MKVPRYATYTRWGKRKYKFKITIIQTRRTDFGARMKDDQIAALDKLLRKVIRKLCMPV